MRWGLVPFWAKDIKVGFANINAKAEGVEDKPTFREAFQRRRWLVRLMSFTSGRRSGRGSNPSEDFESARWPRSLGKQSRFRPTVR
jgi:putative SOS response-associated peptidase YedK